jgi:hypothetical protein
VFRPSIAPFGHLDRSGQVNTRSAQRLLPGESYVEFQLHAQKLRPDSLVITLGYVECAPGSVPTEQAFDKGDGNLRDRCWVAPGAERAMARARGAALEKP